MKRIAAILTLALTCILFSVPTMTAFADDPVPETTEISETAETTEATEAPEPVIPVVTVKDGLEITFTSDRNQYAAGDKIIMTVTVRNTNSFDVPNVELKGVVPEGYTLSKEAQDTLKVEKLPAGESTTLTLELIPADQQNNGGSGNNNSGNSHSSGSNRYSYGNSSSGKGGYSSGKESAPAAKTGDNAIVTQFIVFCISGTLAVLSLVTKKRGRSVMALFLCVGLLGAYVGSVAELRSFAAVTNETRTETISRTVKVGETELALSAIVSYDVEIPVDDNLRDEVLDLGDIQTAVSRGEAEAMYDEAGKLIAVSGNFTDKKITNPAEAVAFLESALPLFGENFTVTESDITVQTVADGSAPTEVFYRYTPVINGVPVEGSQIIVTTSEDGTINSMNSNYTDKIHDVDTNATLSAEDAERLAVEALLANEQVNAFIEENVTEEMDKDAVTEAFRNTLHVSSALLIGDTGRYQTPALMYCVKVDNFASSASALPEGIGQEEDERGELVCGDDNDEEAEEPQETAPEGEAEAETEAPTEPAPALRSGLTISYNYYLFANGDRSGEICRVISGIQSLSTYNATGFKDLKGDKRAFVIQGDDNGNYWFSDPGRKIETYKTNYGGFLWATPELPGELAKITTNLFGNFKYDKQAVSLHANMTDIYDYYKNVLGRNSFDDAGAKVIASYDYDDVNFIFTGDFENAYWSPSEERFVFGDGYDHKYPAAKDTVAHEFTHAVSGHVVPGGLIYRSESGALNEAYSDIMGSLIEGKDRSDGDRWRIGEDKGKASRDISDPTAYNMPDNYSALSDPNWSRELDRYVDRDYEGVHIFSGIYTLAYHNMVTDSRTESVSDETWARIFYRSLFRLSSNATFLDARGAVLCEAKSLGFDDPKQEAIKDAFNSVGIVEPDAVRIVLTWGSVPEDLDSHLTGPGANGSDRFHIYFEQTSYYENGSYTSSDELYAADLDYDDTTSYGPEVTTIHTLNPGTYNFYVHDYTNRANPNSSAMAKSGAVVKVYRGTSSTPLATYNVDSSSVGILWNVCKITVDESMNVTVEAVNTYDTVAKFD